MGSSIESRGIKILIKKLEAEGKKVEKSDNKTFDLKVDGIYAEVKTKGKSYSKLDFLSFTDNQFGKIKKDEFLIFLVCNVKNPNDVEIFRFNSKMFINVDPKRYTSYQYNKSIIDKILKNENRD